MNYPKPHYPKPHLIEIAVYEWCNRECKFCGFYTFKQKVKEINSINLQLIKKIAEDLKTWYYNPRINFSTFGEPFLHNEFPEIIRIFRKTLPNCYLSAFTNTDTLKTKTKLDIKKIKNIFDCGLNHLGLDCYDGKQQVEEYMRVVSLLKDFTVQNFENCKIPIYHKHKPKTKLITIIPCYKKQKGIRKRHNMGGNVDTTVAKSIGETIGEVKNPLKKMCTRPFRDLIIRYDGTVNICCNDWQNEFIVGKFPEHSLKEIWEGKKLMQVREQLQQKIRLFKPCNKCNYYGGTRQGLIQKVTTGFSGKKEEGLAKWIS